MRISYPRRFYVVCMIVLVLAGCSSQSAGEQPGRQHPSASTSSTLLTIVSQPKALPVSPSFIGMNIELVDVCSVLRTDAAHRQAYEQLFENLGTGTLHIAGHSADEGVWKPDARAACLTHPVVTRTLVQAVFAFAHRIHWNVIWGLNFLINDPHMAAAEATYVASVGGSTLLGFSIGNEPELFARHGERSADWGYSNYISEWRADRNAVLAQVPSAQFFGPEACCQTPWFSSFLQDEGSSGTLVAASRHYYYYSGAHASAMNLTPQTLLSVKSMQQFTLAAREWVAEADNEGLPVDITETNSISNGGIAGISNTFGATLWTSDILFQSALLGIHQMDFQQVPDAWYAFINAQGVPQVVYYGLLFFHLAAAQSTLLLSTLNTTENVSAYVLKGTDRTLRVVVINKEPKQGIAITVQPGTSYQKVTMLRMQAASITATSGVTLGNTTLTANGSWPMQTQMSEPVQAGQAILSVPASSAALFTFSA